jgi:hypothetical protein
MTMYSVLKNAIDNAHCAAVSGQLVAAHFGESYPGWKRGCVWVSGFLRSRYLSKIREFRRVINEFENRYGFHNSKKPDPVNEYDFLRELEDYCTGLPSKEADLFRWYAGQFGYVFDDDALAAACASARQFIREFLED